MKVSINSERGEYEDKNRYAVDITVTDLEIVDYEKLMVAVSKIEEIMHEILGLDKPVVINEKRPNEY